MNKNKKILTQDYELDNIFKLIAQVEQIKKFVKRNYCPKTCGYSTLRSFGNADDVFNDGYECGMSWTAYEIGKILGMELDEPEEVDDY